MWVHCGCRCGGLRGQISTSCFCAWKSEVNLGYLSLGLVYFILCNFAVLLFETESLTRISGLTNKLQWLAIEPWGSMHLLLISAELASVHHHTQLFIWKLRAEFRYSWACQHITNWMIPKAATVYFYPYTKKWSPIVTVIQILYMNKLRLQRSPPSSHS